MFNIRLYTVFIIYYDKFAYSSKDVYKIIINLMDEGRLLNGENFYNNLPILKELLEKKHFIMELFWQTQKAYL